MISREWLGVIDLKYFWRPFLVAILILVMALGAVVPAMADTAAVGTVETGLLWGEGINGGFAHNSFHAVGRDWVFYIDHNAGNTSLYDVVYETSADYGLTWTKYVVVSATDTVFRDLAIWYNATSGNVSYVRASTELAAFFVKYRQGTPNADGTVTWHHAEEYVDAADGNIASVTHCVDETGIPWAAWTEIVDGNFTPMAECSSTSNGEWIERATSHKEDFVNATAENVTCYFVSLTPVSDTPYPHVQLSWTELGTAGGPYANLAGIKASFGNATMWSPNEEVVPKDGNGLAPVIYTQSAFTFYDVGSSLVCVYTNRDGALHTRGRSSIQTWDTTSNSTEIYGNSSEPDSWWFPSLAGYQDVGVGEDLLLILHDMYNVYYMKYHFGLGSWDAAPTLLWANPPEGVGELHFILWANVQYKYSSPVGFPWMWGNVNYIPNGPWPEGYLQYWFMDSAALAAGELEPGYYAHSGVEEGIIAGVHVGTGLIAMIYVLTYVLAAIVIVFVLSMVSGGPLALTLIMAAILVVLGSIGVQMILGVMNSW